MRRTSTVLVSVLTTLALATAGCGTSTDRPESVTSAAALDGVRVTGALGTRPEVAFRAPMSFTESGSRVLRRGTGDPIRPGEPFLLQLTLVNARTGKLAISTFDGGQGIRLVRSADDDLFPVLQRAVLGQRQGARLLVAATGEDAYGDQGAPQYGIRPDDAMLMVADVVAVPPREVLDGPDGRARTPAKRWPRVAVSEGVVDHLAFTRRSQRKPRRLVVVPLVEGTGPVVRDDSLVTIDTLTQLWGSSRVVSTTYDRQPLTVPVGTGNVVAAWDKALVGVPRGSRLLVVAPPALAYQSTGSPPKIPGNATLVYVIDVLGVS